MLEGEMLAGEVFKACKEWHVWEQVCDLMGACLRDDMYELSPEDEFFAFLSKKFPSKCHMMWANVRLIKERKAA